MQRGKRERTTQLWRFFSLAGPAVCLWLLGCGSSNNTPPPPPPAQPIGHAYVTTASNLYGNAISAGNGTLTAVNVPSTAGGGTGIASNGQGNYVYVLTSNGMISGYSISHTDGSLTTIAGSPFGGAGVSVAFLTMDAAGKYLFVPVNQDSVVVPYTIASTGALTLGLEVPTPAPPLAATVDPMDRFLYVPMGSTGTQLFQITAGVLTSVKTIPPLGQAAVFVAINPAGTVAYISDGLLGIAAYNINATTGDLTPIASTIYPAGVGPAWLSITPNGKFLYAANNTSIVAFSINADGSLTAIGTPITTTNNPFQMSIDTTGAFLYVVATNIRVVGVFDINESNGVLSAEPGVTFPANPTGIVTTP